MQYPFKSFDGRVTFQRQRSGEREFDITKDGVAHYGLFPDWWEDIRRVGGAAAVSDMARGAEAYLQAWERVEGIRFGCKSQSLRFTRRGLGRLHLRDSTARLLRRGGQPKVRGNSAWSWCVRGKQNRGRRVAAALTSGGKVALVGRNTRRPEAGAGRRAQDRERPLRARGRPSGPLRLRRAQRPRPVQGGGHPGGVEEPHRAAPLSEAREAPLDRRGAVGSIRAGHADVRP